MFDADRPILTSAQDRLNRTIFAKYLARCMLDHQDPESLVIGLYGTWGVGKTSVINLTLEELNFAASNLLDEEKPIILNFSPWSYSGQQQLIYSFFRRLSSALRAAEYFENKERIIHLLELYVSFFTQKPIPKSLRTHRSWFEKLTRQNREEIYAWESGRDLTLVKAELNELLRNQKHKIIIIIDNISRLYDHEIKQIFQIIKSMGDYANTLYLLAMDKEQVIRAINKVDGGGGQQYLEKVVQLPFEIPAITQQDLENILTDRLQEVFKIVPEGAWDAEYWSDIYYSSLKHFFMNCRDVTRYINTLQFSYPRLKDVVNPIDFFALTALEVFLPDVYFGIRDNKDLFSDLLDNVYALTPDQIAKEKARCEEILKRNHRVPREVLLNLFLHLFPRLRHVYQPNLAFYHSDAIARKLRRICSPDLFDAYFRLSIQTGQISNTEFDTILATVSDEEAFDQALNRLNQDERIEKFLDKLDSDIIKHLPEKNIPIIINTLLDDGDLFPTGKSGPLSLDTPTRIHRIIHECLQRINDPDKRFMLLQKAIAKANKSIYITVHELREQGHEHLEEEDTFLPLEFRDLLPEQLESLRKLAVKRIEFWAEHGQLLDYPQLIPILFAWQEWGDAEKCRKFVKKFTDTDRGLVNFLLAIFDKAITQAMTKYEKNPQWINYLEDINVFIPANSLVPHAKALFEDNYFEKLREREQLAIMIFLDVIHADTNKMIPQTTP